MKHIPGVDMSSGSLGQGNLSGSWNGDRRKMDDADYRVYTLLGDGEIQEGQVWRHPCWQPAISWTTWL